MCTHTQSPFLCCLEEIKTQQLSLRILPSEMKHCDGQSVQFPDVGRHYSMYLHRPPPIKLPLQSLEMAQGLS